jgi:hypothetical protein
MSLALYKRKDLHIRMKTIDANIELGSATFDADLGLTVVCPTCSLSAALMKLPVETISRKFRDNSMSTIYPT